MRSLVAAVLVVLTAGLLAPAGGAAAGSTAGASPAVAPAASQPAGPAAAVPRLRVTRLASGLTQPWDVKALGDGRFLVTERDTARLFLVRQGRRSRVGFPRSSVWASGETGLMSLEVDPRFRQNRRFYTCQGGDRAGGGHEVKVLAWRLGGASRRAHRVDVLLRGIQATSGRHGGCRLLITDNGAMLVGTGDAAVGSNPRDLGSLNGKVLRLDPRTGRPWPTNRWADSTNRNRRFVFTYGHRNVQGLAQRRNGTLWSVEHGSFRDDEVNLLRRGHDHGWHPVPEGGGPGYNEQVPMTDQDLPGRQYAARWRSGQPTLATSGAVWVGGREWGSLNGRLAVAALKGQRMVFMRFDRNGRLRSTVAPGALREHGRLRSVVQSPNGDLVVTTANGGNDSVLRVSPR